MFIGSVRLIKGIFVMKWRPSQAVTAHTEQTWPNIILNKRKYRSENPHTTNDSLRIQTERHMHHRHPFPIVFQPSPPSPHKVSLNWTLQMPTGCPLVDLG